MCNEFDKKHIKGYKGFEKLKMINANKNIIDIFGFCGNRYMWSTMNNKEQIDFFMNRGYQGVVSFEPFTKEIEKLDKKELKDKINQAINYLNFK